MAERREHRFGIEKTVAGDVMPCAIALAAAFPGRRTLPVPLPEAAHEREQEKKNRMYWYSCGGGLSSLRLGDRNYNDEEIGEGREEHCLLLADFHPNPEPPLPYHTYANTNLYLQTLAIN